MWWKIMFVFTLQKELQKKKQQFCGFYSVNSDFNFLSPVCIYQPTWVWLWRIPILICLHNTNKKYFKNNSTEQ